MSIGTECTAGTGSAWVGRVWAHRALAGRVPASAGVADTLPAHTRWAHSRPGQDRAHSEGNPTGDSPLVDNTANTGAGARPQSRLRLCGLRFAYWVRTEGVLTFS
jgi:hypothetical protein